MADEDPTTDRSVRYWGWADRAGDFLSTAVDTATMLQEIESRSLEDRLHRLTGNRGGILGEVHRPPGGAIRGLVLYHLEPATVLRVLRSGTIEDIDLAGGEIMAPSWAMFHPGNLIGMMTGPRGGPGKGNLEWWINASELFEERVRLRPILSVGDYDLIERADRVNAATFRIAPEQSVDVGDELLSDLTTMIRERLGEVQVELTVKALKRRDRYEEEASRLQAEVGAIIEQGDTGQFAAARVSVDADGRTGIPIDLLESQVTATVDVTMTDAGGITDARAMAALDAAYEEASGRLTPAITQATE